MSASTPQPPHKPRPFDPGLTGVLPAQGEGEEFWSLARAFVAGLDNPADEDLGLGDDHGAGPRVRVLIHRRDEEETGAMAGVVLCGLLARRGRRTLLLDADEHEMVLTRRAGRTFKSGWLDMIRYGSSLPAAGVEIPWEGTTGYFLGLGSYCPPEVTRKEAAGWLDGLAGEVDDVVVVVGSAAAEPWLVPGAETWFVWDRRRDDQDRLSRTLSELAQDGIFCARVMACGPGASGEAAAGAAPASPVPDDSPPVDEPGDAPVPRHSSGIFRVVALTGLVVVVILAVFIWKFTDLGRMGEVAGPPSGSTARPADREPAPYAGDSSAAGPVAALDTAAVAAVAADSAAGEPSPTTARSSVDTIASAGTASVTVDTTQAVGTTPTGRDTTAVPGPEDLWKELADRFRAPVGRDGWCLHVYSLRDSTAARREMAMVARRGLRVAAAPVTRADSTTWYRVYVGSFPTRGEAAAAVPAVKWKLKTDWAAIAVLPASAWE